MLREGGDMQNLDDLLDVNITLQHSIDAALVSRQDF